MNTQVVINEVTPLVQDFISANLPKLSKVVNPFVPLALTIGLKLLTVYIGQHPEVQQMVLRCQAPYEVEPAIDAS